MEKIIELVVEVRTTLNLVKDRLGCNSIAELKDMCKTILNGIDFLEENA